MRTCLFPFVAGIVLCTLNTLPAVATVPSLGGSVTVKFVSSGDPPSWSWDTVGTANSNTMLLTVPPVIDIAIKPSVIGPATLKWGDNDNWTLPTLDASGFAMLTSGSGTYTYALNNNSGTLDVLMSSGGYGPHNGDATFAQVVVSNVQPSGQPPISGTSSYDSNSVTNKFNVTIPTGAHVTQRLFFTSPIVENLTVGSGDSLDTNGATVRHTLTNHGSGAFNVTVEGDFINDALAANGNVAIVDTNLDVTGQLQNTGDLLIQGGSMRLRSATSNAGQISFSSGSLNVDVSLSNNGTISLSGSPSGSGAIGGPGTLTNNGVLQWSDGYLANVVNNSNSFTITGSGLHWGTGSITNYGSITQSSTNGSQTAGTLTNAAGALYDITNDSGLNSVFGNGTASNAGTLRKSGGTGTSYIGVPFANAGTIAVNTGALAFSSTLKLNSTSTLQFQLSGLTPGTNFGKLDRSPYTLDLAGALAVTLGSGFSPALGNSFDLLDFAGTTGAFSSLQLPPLASGLKWDTSALYTTGALSVAVGLPGDYDQNGAVDPRDYVIWRKYLGTIYTQADYNTWRSHYGQSGSAAALAETSGVPEPASLILLCITALPVLHDPLKRRAAF